MEDAPWEAEIENRILEDYARLSGARQARIADAISKFNKSSWAAYNVDQAHHYAWLWEAIIEGGRTAIPPVHFPPLTVAAMTGCGKRKETGENAMGERWLDILCTLQDFIHRSCPPDTNETARRGIAAEIIRTIIWDIRRRQNWHRSIAPAHVLNNIHRLDEIMNSAYHGLAEGRILHWIA